MFFSVIVGYVLSALFAFAGVMQIVTYVQHVDRSLGYGPFISGLTGSCLWLAAAVVLVLLIQIATFLEKLVIEGRKQASIDGGNLPTPTRTREAAPTGSAGAPASSSSHASGSGQSALQTPTSASAVAPTLDADPEAPRVPDLPGAAPSVSGSAPEQPQAQQGQGLHFFKM